MCGKSTNHCINSPSDVLKQEILCNDDTAAHEGCKWWPHSYQLWPVRLHHHHHPCFIASDVNVSSSPLSLSFSPCRQVTNDGCKRVLDLSDQRQLESSWHAGLDQRVSTDEPHQDRNVVFRWGLCCRCWRWEKWPSVGTHDILHDCVTAGQTTLHRCESWTVKRVFIFMSL